MSAFKGNPGPWCLEDVNSPHLHDICLGYKIPGAGHPNLLATVFFDEDNDPSPVVSLRQANANAKLIAASPELLAACQAILAWADRECMPQGGKADGPWETVEAAVAKATK